METHTDPLNIYTVTTHQLIDTISVEEYTWLSVGDLKELLAMKHPTMCSMRTQLFFQYTVLQDQERLSDYPDVCKKGLLCVVAPARAPTRDEGLMLHHALADRDKDQVLQLFQEGLHRGFLVYSDDGASHNLLQAALVGDFTANDQNEVNGPDPDLTRILISARADVNLIDDSGITPLILATTMDYPAGIRSFISYMADPNLPDQLYEEAPLHYAIQHNSEECALQEANLLLVSLEAEEGACQEEAYKELRTMLHIHGELYTEIRLLEEQQVLFPEVHEALLVATQAVMTAVSQTRDRRDDMAAIVERQQRHLIGISRQQDPPPKLSAQNLRHHDRLQQAHPPSECQDDRETSETHHDTPTLEIVPGACASARPPPSKDMSRAQDLLSAPGQVERGPRPVPTMIERSLLFMARTRSLPGGA
eukprot:s658_g25.t1